MHLGEHTCSRLGNRQFLVMIDAVDCGILVPVVNFTLRQFTQDRRNGSISAMPLSSRINL
jgi:hypothetical protein